MRRARHPVPIPITRLCYNPKIKKYEIVERGIKYSMDLECTRLLKKYFKGADIGCEETVAEWYSTLDKQTKKQVNREMQYDN